MKRLPEIWITFCLLAASPVAVAEPTAQERAARALSRILTIPVAADDVEIRPAASLSPGGSLPSPLRRIAGTEKRYLVVRLKAAKFRHPVVQATFEVLPRWAKALPDVGAVVVEATNSSSVQSCWVETCTDGACQTEHIWVDEGVSCPPAQSGSGTGGDLFCTLQVCKSGLGCETMPVPPLPSGGCPETDLCSSDEDCQPPTKECPAGECFCTADECRCMENSVEVAIDESCPTAECADDNDCASGGGNGGVLDNILETTTAFE